MVTTGRASLESHHWRPGARSLTRRLVEVRSFIESIGQPSWACTSTAAALLGFDTYELLPPYHALVPRGRSVSRVGHVVHRARDLSRLDTTVVDDIPCTSATRTIIDLAATEPPHRLSVAIDSALRDRLTSETFLHARIVELRRRGRAGLTTLLDVLAGEEVTRGGHSWLERRFRELLHERGFPLPRMQQVMGVRHHKVIRVDCTFPGTNVVVELLGYGFHRSPMEMQNDAGRLNRLILDGLHPMQFTYADVATESPQMFADLREALGLSGHTQKRT